MRAAPPGNVVLSRPCGVGKKSRHKGIESAPLLILVARASSEPFFSDLEHCPRLLFFLFVPASSFTSSSFYLFTSVVHTSLTQRPCPPVCRPKRTERAVRCRTCPVGLVGLVAESGVATTTVSTSGCPSTGSTEANRTVVEGPESSAQGGRALVPWMCLKAWGRWSTPRGAVQKCPRWPFDVRAEGGVRAVPGNVGTWLAAPDYSN